MTAPGYPGLTWGPINIDKLRNAVNQILQGRTNCAGQVTLNVSTTTTTVVFAPITAKSRVVMEARSANAAAVVTTTWVSQVIEGTGFVIAHPSNANADKTFDWHVQGGM
jgi:hypothetical protein